MSNPDHQISKVVADDLSKDQVSEMIQYILGMSKIQLRQKGKTFEVAGLPRKQLKFLLHKFLHRRRLDEYGVLDTSGVFEIVHIKPKEKKPVKHENLKASMPFDPYTANAHGRPLYAPWMNPSDLVEWQGKAPGKKKRDY